MELGFLHGIRFRFDGGLLAAALLDVHRKPVLELREHLLGAGVHPGALVGAEEPPTYVEQEIGVGLREIGLLEPADEGTTAQLHLQFALDSPLDWRLQVEGEGRPVEQGVEYTLASRVVLTVESSVPCAVDRSGVVVPLPVGDSAVVLTLSSKPVFDLGDTVVVCRPDQVREAAVIVSCLPADRLTPIIAVEPAPMSEAEYVELYREFERTQDESQQLGGTELGMAELMSGDVAGILGMLSTQARLAALRESLSEYRSWLKHNEMVNSLLFRMAVERAVFLHDFRPEELNDADPVLRDRARAKQGKPREQDGDGEPVRMFSEIPTKVHLKWTTPAELTDVAWRALRDPDGEPARTIEVPAEDPSRYAAALFSALRADAALRVVERSVAPADELLTDLGTDPALDSDSDSDEAVLVENTADVKALWGAIYAHHRKARLVVTPRPDLRAVERAVADQQDRITAAARAAGQEVKGPAFGERLRLWLSSLGRNPYRDVESTVTAQVPPAAISAVGGRRLTAFTTGLPYTFVRNNEVDWSRKPIGHVATDPELIVLNEVYSAGAARSAATFSLILDPGFFQTSETDDVMRSVEGHFTHPILLSGPGQVPIDDLSTLWGTDGRPNLPGRVVMDGLIDLPVHLPVELIFINTHGSDDGILLGEYLPLDNWLIPQWMSLRHRPIVFNNSCQSWTGVGRQFVRVGARGYIGSLWSIPSNLAADFGRVVIDRLTEARMRACDAIVDTGLSAGIERSYLYVGTANGRLAQWGERSSTAGDAVLAECVMLADAATKCRGPLVHLLRDEIAGLRRLVEGTPYERTLPYADVLLQELLLHVTAAQPDEEESAGLAHRIEEGLTKIDLPPEFLDPRWATLFELTGALHEKRGRLAPALDAFQRSIAYGEACQRRANILLRMAQILKHQGKYDEALRLARSGHDLCLEEGDEDTLVGAIGILGQLTKRTGDYAEAMRLAEDGHRRAVGLADRSRQAAFKLDQSMLHHALGDHDAAISAAVVCLELSRAEHDAGGELRAIGRLCWSYREKGDWETLGKYAAMGLAQARKLDIPEEVAAFHRHLGEVVSRQDRHVEALEHYRTASTILGELGAWELAAGAIAFLSGCATRLGDADALWLAVTSGFRVCSAVEPALGFPLLAVIVAALKEAIEVGTRDTTVDGLLDLTLAVGRLDPDGLSLHMAVLVRVLMLMWIWREGEYSEKVTEVARELDGTIVGVGFGLVDFVSIPFEQRGRGGSR